MGGKGRTLRTTRAAVATSNLNEARISALSADDESTRSIRWVVEVLSFSEFAQA